MIAIAVAHARAAAAFRPAPTRILRATRSGRTWFITLRTAHGDRVTGSGADFDAALADAERKGGAA